MSERTLPGPDPQAIPVPGLLHDFGERWQIEHRGNVWIAVRRPTVTSYELHVAYTSEELAAKLAAAEGGTPR
jgi:hypothetical protein